MPNNDTWPPKPTLPDPLTEYDDVIAAKLAALLEMKTGPNNIQLIKALRDEEGIDLRQAYAAVNNYCERHGAFARTRTSRMLAWLGCLPPLALLCCAGAFFYWMKRRHEILSQPHHHAAIVPLDREAFMIICFVTVIVCVYCGIQIILIQRRRHKK